MPVRSRPGLGERTFAKKDRRLKRRLQQDEKLDGAQGIQKKGKRVINLNTEEQGEKKAGKLNIEEKREELAINQQQTGGAVEAAEG